MILKKVLDGTFLARKIGATWDFARKFFVVIKNKNKMFQAKNIQKKFILIALFAIIFFGAQTAVIFYAKKTIKNAVANKDASSFTNAQLEQINNRLISLEQRINYIQSYIIANNNSKK
ncbi:hypothetical protein HYV44_03435 [Candidatus Microgenomates bacterium]|nr:hypothetical protein [Candidatus Microgenomates bacterium]